LSLEISEKQFKKSLKDCIKHPEVSDSPVIETLGGRGTLYSIVHEEENQRRLMGLHLELDENKGYLTDIREYCEKNKALRAKGKVGRKMVSGSLRKSASELLYTNRYLDLPEKNYRELGNYLDRVYATNLQIEHWSTYPVQCEEWFLKHNKDFLNRIKSLKKTFEFKPIVSRATQGRF